MFYRNLTYIVEIFSKSLSFGNIIYLDRNEKKKKMFDAQNLKCRFIIIIF